MASLAKASYHLVMPGSLVSSDGGGGGRRHAQQASKTVLTMQLARLNTRATVPNTTGSIS